MRSDDFDPAPATHKTMMASFVAGLRQRHSMTQMGGAKRFYKIGNTSKVGIIFLLEGSDKAVGVAWVKGTKTVASLYIWNVFDPDHAPDLAIDIPADAAVDGVLDQLDKFIKNPKIGVMEASSTMGRWHMPGDSDPQDEVRPENETPAAPQASEPAQPAAEPAPKTDPIKPTGSSKTMKVVPAPKGDIDTLAKRLIKRGEVVLMGRHAEGEYFVIPGVEGKIRQLDKMLDQKVAKETGGKTMEEQYEELEEEVRMVASGNSKFTKSLIITGMPSAGKSFRVMKVIESLGLEPGDDYIVKKGRVTDAAMYRTFIEQIDGLIVMDDCDSMWESTNGANMLKNVLDTVAVRSVNNDSSRTVNTAAMRPEARRQWLLAASRVLRGEPIAGDLERFLPDLHKAEDHSQAAYETYLTEAQAKIVRTPPNQIDFTGRMIFISNLDRSQLDPAVLTRSNHIDLNFSDEEMLDFIETIGSQIENVEMGDNVRALTPEEIAEVFAFVRERLATHGFNSPINFRFFQKAYDARRSNSATWERRVANF